MASLALYLHNDSPPRRCSTCSSTTTTSSYASTSSTYSLLEPISSHEAEELYAVERKARPGMSILSVFGSARRTNSSLSSSSESSSKCNAHKAGSFKTFAQGGPKICPKHGITHNASLRMGRDLSSESSSSGKSISCSLKSSHSRA